MNLALGNEAKQMEPKVHLFVFGNAHFPHTTNASQHWKNQESWIGLREYIRFAKPRHPSIPVLWLLVGATGKTRIYI